MSYNSPERLKEHYPASTLPIPNELEFAAYEQICSLDLSHAPTRFAHHAVASSPLLARFIAKDISRNISSQPHMPPDMAAIAQKSIELGYICVIEFVLGMHYIRSPYNDISDYLGSLDYESVLPLQSVAEFERAVSAMLEGSEPCGAKMQDGIDLMDGFDSTYIAKMDTQEYGHRSEQVFDYFAMCRETIEKLSGAYGEYQQNLAYNYATHGIEQAVGLFVQSHQQRILSSLDFPTPPSGNEQETGHE